MSSEFVCPQCKEDHFRSRDIAKIARYRDVVTGEHAREDRLGEIISTSGPEYWYCTNCGYRLDETEYSALMALLADESVRWTNSIERE